MSNKKFKQPKNSLVEMTTRYTNNLSACVQFFIDCKWPTGFFCDTCNHNQYYSITRGHVLECTKCHHQHYLFAGTIFQDNKLDLYKLILGLYLFFTANKGYSAIEMASTLEINYKSALRLCRKCRILMASSNSQKVLDSMFYESDVTYIGSQSKDKPGMASEQQPFLVILSTDQDNKYPRFIKLCAIPKDNGKYIENFMEKRIKLSKDRVLNTDGKTTFNVMSDKITWNGEKIIHEEKNHRLHWLNTIWSNIKYHIIGIYHGLPKRSLPLFVQEQEWRFNHRQTGKEIINKVLRYILDSSPITDKVYSYILDISESSFSLPVSEG